MPALLRKLVKVFTAPLQRKRIIDKRIKRNKYSAPREILPGHRGAPVGGQNPNAKSRPLQRIQLDSLAERIRLESKKKKF